MTQLENDICEVEFSIAVAGENVPCVVWKPRDSVKSRVMIAMGHGGVGPRSIAS